MTRSSIRLTVWKWNVALAKGVFDHQQETVNFIYYFTGIVWQVTIDLYRMTSAEGIEFAITICCHGCCQKRGLKFLWVTGSWGDGLTSPSVNRGKKTSTKLGSSCILAMNIVCGRCSAEVGDVISGWHLAVKLSQECQWSLLCRRGLG